MVPSLVGCNTLISAYAKAGEPELAFEALGLMRKSGLLPNDITLTTLFEAARHEGHGP